MLTLGWIIVPLLSFRMHAAEAACKALRVPKNGAIKNLKSHYAAGETMNVICNDLYELFESRMPKCEPDGTWTTRHPRCTFIKCPALDIAHGKLSPQRWRALQVLAVICDKGYERSGSARVTCSRSGTWVEKIPTCVPEGGVTCPAPSVPNGVKQGGEVSVYRLSDAVTFDCSAGFLLTGSSQVTCGPDGQWLPRLPECRPPPGDCGVPPSLSSSHAHLADSYRSQTSFSPGSRVRYECDVGYVRGRGSSFRTCNQGHWSPLQMRCELRSCGSAGQVDNGRFVYSGSEFGDSARAECNKGYQLVGHGTRNCLSGGWDGRVPVCEVVQCAEPPEVANADRFGNPEPPYVYSTVIRYRCRVGTLVGERDMYCTKDGLWSSPPPQCRG